MKWKWLSGLMTAAILRVPAWAGPGGLHIAVDALGFPEGPVVANGSLYFVDYRSSTVNRLDGDHVSVVHELPGCGANGLAAAQDALWVACYDSGAVQRLSLDGNLQEAIDHSTSGQGFDRPNDLVADRHGNLFFTASGHRAGDGKVFFLSRSSKVAKEVASGLDNANGVALSADATTLLVGESGRDRILSFRVGVDGELHGVLDFARLDDLAPRSSAGRHTPDGIRIGPDGLVYVALFNGGGCWVLDRDGRLLRTLDVPGPHHSNLAVIDGGRAIYVTSIADTCGRIYWLSLR